MTDRAPCHYSGKISYASEREANRSRTAMTTTRRLTSDGRKRHLGDLQSFKCRECGNWHLGRPRTVNNSKPFGGEE